MSSRIKVHRPVVWYQGTMTDMHGYWHVAASSGTRLRLESAYGLALRGVRPANVRPVEVPAFTPKRADALHLLATYPGRRRIDARAAKWLVANKLAEVDEETSQHATTQLGREVQKVLPRWY
jgi:hypothetical protein